MALEPAAAPFVSMAFITARAAVPGCSEKDWHLAISANEYLLALSEMADAARELTRRIMLLDYDGTLMPFAKLPSMAMPTPEMLITLKTIAENPLNDLRHIYALISRLSTPAQEWRR